MALESSRVGGLREANCQPLFNRGWAEEEEGVEAAGRGREEVARGAEQAW